jgi:hypothetical protein
MRLSILEEKGLFDAHFPLVLGLVRVTSGKISIDSSSQACQAIIAGTSEATSNNNPHC